MTIDQLTTCNSAYIGSLDKCLINDGPRYDPFDEEERREHIIKQIKNSYLAEMQSSGPAARPDFLRNSN